MQMWCLVRVWGRWLRSKRRAYEVEDFERALDMIEDGYCGLVKHLAR